MTEPLGDRPRRRRPGHPATDPAAGAGGPARPRDASGGGSAGRAAPRGADRSTGAQRGAGKNTPPLPPPADHTPAKKPAARSTEAKGSAPKRSSAKGSAAASTPGAPAKPRGRGQERVGGRRSGSGRGPKTAAAPEPAPAEAPVRGAGGRWPMADRSVLPTVLGVPPLAAVGLAAALTAVGVLVDLTQVGSLGTVFTICYISGCVLAVAWVRRAGLFGPIVQPPLLVALSVPVVVLLAGSPRPGQGVAERLLVIGAPLVNAFPVMAWTTGIVLVFGLLRVLLQRPLGADVSGRSGRGAARGAGRT